MDPTDWSLKKSSPAERDSQAKQLSGADVWLSDEDRVSRLDPEVDCKVGELGFNDKVKMEIFHYMEIYTHYTYMEISWKWGYP